MFFAKWSRRTWTQKHTHKARRQAHTHLTPPPPHVFSQGDSVGDRQTAKAHIHTHTQPRTHASTHTHTYTAMHVCKHTYTHIHSHARMQRVRPPAEVTLNITQICAISKPEGVYCILLCAYLRYMPLLRCFVCIVLTFDQLSAFFVELVRFGVATMWGRIVFIAQFITFAFIRALHLSLIVS